MPAPPPAQERFPAIEVLQARDWDDFFRYLGDQRARNGCEGTGYFLPLSRAASCAPSEREKAFREALSIPLGAPGWRCAWAARAPDRSIVGHVDLRAHPDRFAEHRCLLGMGVHQAYRRLGIGRALLDHAIRWALHETSIEWCDLQVLSGNAAALRLYTRAGFVTVSEVPDMFRMDGQAFGLITMTRRIRPPAERLVVDTGT